MIQKKGYAAGSNASMVICSCKTRLTKARSKCEYNWLAVGTFMPNLSKFKNCVSYKVVILLFFSEIRMVPSFEGSAPTFI